MPKELTDARKLNKQVRDRTEKSSRLITCERLTKAYGKSKINALDSLDFSIPSEGVFVLIGRNGSGKTTLVRILATELEPTSGRATVNGLDVMKDTPELRERIAIVPQEARPIPWMTPMQTIRAYLLWRGFGYSEAKKRAVESLEKLGLEKYGNALNRTLSGGMKRKVLVCTVLASEAEIVFLDEPTTGLDPVSRKEFWEVLEDIGKERFTFLTTHYLEEAEELADNIGVLDRGRLVSMGTLENMRKSISFNYSLKLLTTSAPLDLLEHLDGETVKGRNGFVRILTTEEEAFEVARELSKRGLKFAINPISLDDIFFYLVSRGGNQEIDVEELGREAE